MKKTLILILFLLTSFQIVYGQRSFTFNVGVGTSNYYGELTNNLLPQFTKANESITAGYYFIPNLQLRLGFTHGMISGNDVKANDDGRVIRNLHFRNRLIEWSGVIVYEFMPEKQYGRPWEKRTHFTPFIFAGIARFSHNPQGEFQNNWYELQPLGTEGQFISNSEIEPYSLKQISVPIGLGITYRFYKALSMNIEVGYRKTFTDYLDDVSSTYPNQDVLSQVSGEMAPIFSMPSDYPFTEGFIRGNPDSKDGYLFTNISLGYILGKKK